MLTSSILMVDDKSNFVFKKFKIVSLQFPADYNQTVLIELMKEAQSFHMWFDRDANKPDQMKTGGISLTFDDETTAKTMYLKIKDLNFNSTPLKVLWPQGFDEAVVNEDVVPDNIASSEHDEEIATKLYVSHLLPTTDEDLIYAVFGQENLKSVEINLDNRRKDGTKTAILTFHNREIAQQSKVEYDGFVVDDGELSRAIKILFYADHLKRMEASNSKNTRVVEKVFQQTIAPETIHLTSDNQLHSNGDESSINNAGIMWSAQIVESRCPEAISGDEVNEKIQEVIKDGEKNVGESNSVDLRAEILDTCQTDAQFSGEMSIIELEYMINFIVERDRINWGEMNTLEELWGLVNKVVQEIGWQPEVSLKEAMLNVLEAAKLLQTVDWWQEHTKFLIRLWTKEVETESRCKTRVKLQLTEKLPDVPAAEFVQVPVVAAPFVHYVPPTDSSKPKRSKSGKKALMGLMGVGALLANVQKEHAEEEATKVVETRSVTPPEKSVPVNTSVVNKEKKIRVTKPKRRRRSSCESGEASSTTSESEASVSSAEYSRDNNKIRDEKLKRRMKPSTQPTVAAKDQVKNDKKIVNRGETNSMNGAAIDTASSQNSWFAQAMPMFMQMMPMMMQMCQLRMTSMATMTPQQQQQFMEQFQAQMAQTFQQYRPQNPSAAAFNPMNMMNMFQKMHVPNVPTTAASVYPNPATVQKPTSVYESFQQQQHHLPQTHPAYKYPSSYHHQY